MTEAEIQKVLDERVVWCQTHGYRVRKVEVRHGVCHYECGPKRGGITMACMPTEHPTCPGCENEIDPETCHCGETIKPGVVHDNHSPVPMGCDCGRVKAHEKLEKELNHPWG